MARQPCPHCGEDNPEALEGIEIPEVYDGILIWHCFACGKAWRRIIGIKEYDLAARNYAIEWNQRVQQQSAGETP